jgi:hypothetical protein
MAEPIASRKIPLTLQLSADVAMRLQAVAELQKRSAADLAADLLERNLPRLQTDGTKKLKIPYT